MAPETPLVQPGEAVRIEPDEMELLERHEVATISSDGKTAIVLRINGGKWLVMPAGSAVHISLHLARAAAAAQMAAGRIEEEQAAAHDDDGQTQEWPDGKPAYKPEEPRPYAGESFAN
jgi:hypothetical protein